MIVPVHVSYRRTVYMSPLTEKLFSCYKISIAVGLFPVGNPGGGSRGPEPRFQT